MRKINIFLSYCWDDSNEANKIYDYFKSSQNIELHRDIIDIGEWGSIKEYMQSISYMDYTILLISDSYLKSANCMYEVLEVMRDRNYRDKIFPTVIYSRIYNPITRAKYVKHWQDEFSELESSLKEINVQNLGKLNEDLKRRQDISSNIAEFLGVVSDMNNPNIEDVCVVIEEKLSQKGFIGNNQIRLMEDIDHIKADMNGKKSEKAEHSSEIPAENKAQYYADKWNKNVFLDNFDEEDEKAGDRLNVKLKDIYLEELLPPYILNENRDLSYKLKERLKKYIVEKKDREMLLILGQPGIGKSTLITWIMANLVEKKDEIFVYQFAADLKKVNWQEENVLEEIFKVLRLEEKELKDKVLILDGFDEISISDNRERILNKLSHEVEVKRSLGMFSLIITCRENYIDSSNLSIKCYIILQTWNKNQIKCFCDIYEKKSSGNSEAKFSEVRSNKILENEDIFGIPLILYMTLALNITIEEKYSIVGVYDQIFSLDGGGIYNRCYDTEHRTNEPEVKTYIHQISQRIAFWIFENNDDEAFIYQKNFKEICDTVMLEAKDKSEDKQSNTLIGSYFKIKHCEGQLADEVNFIHRSIYEYFVAVYFFESIRMLTSKEKVAGKLGELLKRGRLSNQLLEYIKYKFDSMQGYNLPDITKKVFNVMLKDGMTYHTNIVLNDGATYHIKEEYRNMVNREINIFTNMLELVGLWNSEIGNVDNKIFTYLHCNKENGLNLKGFKLIDKNFDMEDINLNSVYLYGANLRDADLGEIDLSGADLRYADLTEANLSGANLSGADLGYSNLSKAILSKAILRRANLSEASFDKADISVADLRGADLSYSSLIGTDLRETNLRGANLREANLMEADLSETNLRETNLRETDLRGADLREADLSGVDLSGTIFDKKQVNMLHKEYDLSKSMVYLFETEEIVSYDEYCIRKQKNEI